MRVLVRLEAVCNSRYVSRYHHLIQGFVYSLLRGTDFEYLHDKRGYKFFCFSNVFPAYDLKKGDSRNFIVSSPSADFVNVVAERLQRYLGGRVRVRFGRMEFLVRGLEVFQPQVESSCGLITGTPIVVRIPRYRYEEYGIRPPKPYRYVFWRSTYSFTAFVKQLEDNLFKKYSEFTGEDVEPHPFFQEFEFRREVALRLRIGSMEGVIIGSVWKFGFRGLSSRDLKILSFGLDTGLGEMNPKGFGFMNLDRENIW